MNRFIITSVLLASMVLLGCEDPSTNLNSGHGNYGDIRDEIALGYQFNAAEAAFFADYGIDQSMMDALDTWTPEQVEAYTEAFAALWERALEFAGDPENAERFERASSNAAQSGLGEVREDLFSWEFGPVEMTEPISSTREVTERVLEDGTVVEDVTIFNVYAPIDEAGANDE